jgi:hypothetical protein
MLKKSGSGVLASLRGSTYRSLRLHLFARCGLAGRAFLSILRGCLLSSHTSTIAMASAAEMGFRSSLLSQRATGHVGWAGSRSAVLYVGVLMATQRNPVTRTLYQRLCQAGRVKTLTWMACMRKRLTIVNAVLKNGMPWRAVTSQSD